METRITRDERGTQAMIAEARGFRSVSEMDAHYEARGVWPSGEKVERSSTFESREDAEHERSLEIAVAYFEGVLGESA